MVEYCPTGRRLGGIRHPDHRENDQPAILGLGRQLTVVVGSRTVGGVGGDGVSTTSCVEANPEEVTMFQALSNGIVGVWNYAIPGAVKVVNDVLHAVYEPTHQAIHALADVLTIAIK